MGAFRVGKRAKVTYMEFDENMCVAKHDGYSKIKGDHNRKFTYKENEIIIEDTFMKNNNFDCEANFHFHNKVKILEINDDIIKISDGIIFNFYSSSNLKINVSNYELAQGFNKTIKSKKISVIFKNKLSTQNIIVKILIFYQYFTTPKGSWGTRIYEFSKQWIKKGHDVTVVTSIYSKSDLKATNLIETQIIEGINVKVINIKIDNKQPLVKRILTFIIYSIISSWYALILKADVVIASSGPITVGIPGLISKIFTKKLVYEVRDLWPEVPIAVGIIKNKLIKKIAFYFEKKLYSNASLVVGLSPGIRDYIKNNFSHKNVISITNSANLNLFGKKNLLPKNDFISENDFYGIYTGNIGRLIIHFGW